MNLFVITNCGSSDIEIIGVTTIRPNTCFGWKVDDFVSLKSWDGKFFVAHQALPDTLVTNKELAEGVYAETVSGEIVWYKNGDVIDEPEYIETVTRVANPSRDLIVGGYKIPNGERSPVIDLSGEMLVTVDE